MLMAGSFCVLSTQRTGSTYLCSLLNSHFEICCHQELFEHVHIEAVLVAPVVKDREAREREPLRWLDAVMAASSAHNPRWRAIGFKLHLLQWPSVLERILFEPGFAILLLDRADRLAQYASRKILDQTRLFRSTGAEPKPPPTVRFDAEEFALFARQHEDLYQMVRTVVRGRADVLDLDYDGLLERDTHRRALEFLGVDPAVMLSAPERKQNPGDVLARFVNPGDVVAALRQTQWAPE
jgi:LPS sulfotransferase NodH